MARSVVTDVSTEPNSFVFNVQRVQKIKELRSFETCGTINPAAQRHISEELTPHQHGCENFVSRVMRDGGVFCVPGYIQCYLHVTYVCLSMHVTYGDVYFQVA